MRVELVFGSTKEIIAIVLTDNSFGDLGREREREREPHKLRTKEWNQTKPRETCPVRFGSKHKI